MGCLQKLEGVVVALEGVFVMVEDKVHRIVKVLEPHWI